MRFSHLVPIFFGFSLLFPLKPALAEENLAQTLSGRILLQVHSRGEAWYVSPMRGTRRFLGSADNALAIMRTEGLGITNGDLGRIPVGFFTGIVGPDADSDGVRDVLEVALGTNPNNRDTDGDGFWDDLELLNGYSPIGSGFMAADALLVNRLRGRILLQVQGRGEAWYVNPLDGKRYFLGQPAEALRVMSQFGLGITNFDIARIPQDTSTTTLPGSTTPTTTSTGSTSSPQAGSGSSSPSTPSSSGTASPTASFQSTLFPIGRGRFVFESPNYNPRRPIPVWTYVPPQATASSQILFVIHGVDRNAETYRNSWIEQANRYNVIIVTPEILSSSYPEGTGFQQGYTFTSSGQLRSENEWLFTAMDGIFTTVRSSSNTNQTMYDIYGHSAGGQFVHRLALLRPSGLWRRAVAANAGFYTFPRFQEAWPYGLIQSPGSRDRLASAFGRELIVLVGALDTSENDPNLTRTPEAMLQGRQRVERANAFFSAAQTEASRLSVPFVWRMRVVPGVGHSNPGMLPTAAVMLYGGG